MKQKNPDPQQNQGNLHRLCLVSNEPATGLCADRRAFTLIELLVVIAIIAILAAILLPVLEKAEQRSQTAACLNNMKQLGTAYRMYVDDNNDYLPPNETPTWGVAITNSWVGGDAQNDVLPDDIQQGMLYQYDKDVRVYACPANTLRIKVSAQQAIQARLEGFAWMTAGSLVPMPRTCSIDFALGGFNAAALTTPGTLPQGGVTYDGLTTLAKFSQIQLNCQGGVAGKFVFCDEGENSVDDGCMATYAANQNYDYYWNLPGCRHDGNRACTWSFADGHCEIWRWHGNAIIADRLLPSGTSPWPADPLTGPGSSDDLSRVEAATIINQ